MFKSLAQSVNGTCVFNFQVQANQPPGTYWYHAHLHAVRRAGRRRLAGTIVVVPSPAPSLTPSDLDLPTRAAGQELPRPAARAERQLVRRLQNAAARAAAPCGPRRAALHRAFDPFNPPPYESRITTRLSRQHHPRPVHCPGDPSSLCVHCAPMPTAATDAALASTPNVPTVYQYPSGPGMRYRVVNAFFRPLPQRPPDRPHHALHQPVQRACPRLLSVTCNLYTRIVYPEPARTRVPRQRVPRALQPRPHLRAGQAASDHHRGRRAAFCTRALAFSGIPPRASSRSCRERAHPCLRRPLRASSARYASSTREHRPPRRPSPTSSRQSAIPQSSSARLPSASTTRTFYVTETGSQPNRCPRRVSSIPSRCSRRVAAGPSPLPTDSRYQATSASKTAPGAAHYRAVEPLHATGEAHAFHIHQIRSSRSRASTYRRTASGLPL